MKRLIFILLSFTVLLLAFTSVYGDHFEVVYNEGTSHSLVIENAFINDQPLEEQDEIGVFTPGGICAGVVVVTDEGAPFGTAVYGDNPESEQRVGFLTNEEFAFLIWDAFEGREYDARAQFTSGPRTWQPDGLTRIARVFYYDDNIPVIMVSTSSIDFGLVGVNHTLNLTLTVENIGYGDLSVNDIVVVNQVFETNFDDLNIDNLEPGESFELTVMFTPAAARDYSGELRIFTDDPNNGMVRVILTGEGTRNIEPDISLSELEHDYGEWRLHYTIEWVLRISNDGTDDLTIEDVDFDDDVYSSNWDGDPFVIVPRETHHLIVKFTPDTTEEYPGTLTIRSDDPDEDELTVSLSGVGVVSEDHFINPRSTDTNQSLLVFEAKLNNEWLSIGDEIAVFDPDDVCAGYAVFTPDLNPAEPIGLCAMGDDPGSQQDEGFEEGEEFRFLYWDISAGVEVDAEPQFLMGVRVWSPDAFTGLNLSGNRDPLPIISATPMVKNFGEVHANQTYESVITVTNNGETALSVFNIVSSQPRYFDVDFEVGFVLAPEEYRNVAITFQPDDVDDYQAELNITSNGHHQELTVVELRGTGITPPQTIEVSEIEHDFGQVQVDQVGTWELIISNSGWAELVIDRIESDDNAFTTNFPDNPVRLGREEDMSVEVYFMPDQNGFFNGTLTIHSNDDENPAVDIQLSGEGVSYAGIVVDPLDLDFGMILVGDLLAQRFTITNEGNADLHITGIFIDGEGFFVNFDGEITLGPDESQAVPVYFYPDWDDEFNAQVIIESDDEEQGEVWVGLNGESYMPSQDIQLRYAQGEVYIPEFDIHDIVDDFDNAHHALGVDLDRDGDVDILGVADIDDEISWWDNDGEQNFTKFVISSDFDGAGKVHYADIDADGDIDVIGGAHGANQISWWENDGRMNFDEHVLVQNFDALGVYGIDMDDDLDIDILGVDRINGIYYWENDGNSGFTRRTVVDNFEGCWTAYPVDLDDDYDMDVIAASSNTNQVVWFENDGSQDFSRHTIANNFRDSRSAYPIDLDNDGDWDIVAAAFGDDEVAWFENDGNESFSKHTLLDDFTQANRVNAADLDEDGDVDITAVSFQGNEVVWLENDGSEEFTTHDISPGYRVPTSISTADIDSDGYLDILASFNSNKISWFENLYQVEHDFGNCAINEETTWIFTITNVGQERLRVRTITPAPDDGIFTTDFEEQATILPAASIQVVVSFQPDYVDLFEGVLIIESDDPDEDAVIVPLNGEGIIGNEPPVVINPIEDLVLDEDFEELTVAWLDTVFEDPDGDEMTYSAISNNGNFIVRVDGNDRVIFDSAEHWYGDVLVTVTADDGYELRDEGEGMNVRQLRIIARSRPEHGEDRAFSLAGRDDGDYRARIHGRDFTTDHIVRVTVNSVNDPPVWEDVPGDTTIEEGAHLVFSVSGSDIENDILDIIPDIPEGAEFTDNGNGTGDFDWQTDNDDAGNYTVTLLLTDRTDTTTARFIITVGDVNQPPIWTNLPGQVIGYEALAITFTVEAFDPDADILEISATSEDLPEGWEFSDNENGRGTFNWMPGYEDEGNYNLTVTASDGQIPVPVAVSIIIYNVNQPPEWVDPPDTVRVNEGEELLFNVEAIDPDGEVPELSAASDDLPDGWEFTDNDDGTGVFRWTTTFDDSGDYTLTLTASDNEATTETDVTVIVNHVNRPPYFIDPPEIVDGQEGEELVFIFEAGDPDGDDVSIWISSDNPPGGIQFTDNGDGTATLVWTPGWEDEGDYDLTVSVTDDEYEVDADFVISVARGNREHFWIDIPDSVEVNEGEELSFTVEADDLDGDDLSLWVSSDELPEGWDFTDYGDYTGEFVWTPGYDDSGQYTATFTAYDGLEWYVDEDVVFTVHHVNREPYWVNIPDFEEAEEGEEIRFTVTGIDPDGDDLTIDARSDDLPNGWQFSDNGDGMGVFSWQTDYADSGNYTAYFTLSDGEYPIEEDVLIAVGNTNRPPRWVSIPARIDAAEPELIEVTLIAVDPDGDQIFITFEEQGWPEEVSFTDHHDGTATFYWQTDYNSAGDYIATFSVTDGDLSISTEVPVTVANTNRPPDWDYYPEHVYADEDDLIQFTVQGSDLDGDPLSIGYESADIPDADFSDNHDGSGDFSWQTSAADEGEYVATFTLFDGEDYVPVDVPITITHVDHAPTWDDIPVRVEVNEDVIVSFSFAGSDLDDDQLSITVFSDNLPDGEWGYSDNGDGTGSFTWQTTFEDAGEYSADFSLTDDQFIADTSVVIVVNNVNRQPEWYCDPAEPEGTENEELQFTIFTSDPDGDDVSFEITAGLPEGMNVQDNGDDSHTFSWTPGYDDDGDYRVEFDVSDEFLTTSGSLTFGIINVNRPPVWDDTPGQVEVLETEEVRFSVSGSDPDNDNLRIIPASEDLPNGWSFTDNGNGTGDFSWETSYADSGEYTLTLTITDGEDSTSADVSIVVNNYNPQPVWDNLPRQRTVDEGDLFSFTVRASDPAGEDDLEITWHSDNMPEDIQFTEMDDPDRVLVEWQTDYADSGEYVITFTVSDGEWDIEADLTIVVNDVNPPPVFDVIPLFYTADETEVIQFAIRGHDPDGSAVTISYSSDDLPDVIEFVDNENGTASFTWHTTQEDAGEYTATFTISDGVNDTPADVPITVRNLNRSPVWDDVPELVEIDENERIEFPVFGSDPDDDNLQILDDIPAGAQFIDNGDGSGLFVWQTTYDDSGSYTATFTLTDGFEPVDASVTIIVFNMNRPPEWVDVPSEPIVADENEIIDFIVTGIDLDADDDLTILYDSDNIPEAADFTDFADGTASFHWQPNYDDAGDYSCHLTLSDGMIQVDTTVQIIVNNVNRRPFWVDLTEQEIVDEEQTLEFTVSASDPDGDRVFLTASSLDIPLGWEFVDNDDGTGSFNWTPDYEDSGEYTLSVRASDTDLWAVSDITIRVINVNQAPVWDNIPNYRSVEETEIVQFFFHGYDPDGDVVTINIDPDNLPDGYEFVDNGDGSGSFLWETTYDDSGTYRPVFLISDNALTTGHTVIIDVGNVNQPPFWTDIPAEVQVREGDLLEFTMSAEDTDDDDLSFSFDEDDVPDDPEDPDNPFLDDRGLGTARFTWTPTYADQGVYDVTFSVSDGIATIDRDVRITVIHVNLPPVWTRVEEYIRFGEGDLVVFSVEGEDPDNDNLTIDYYSDDLPEEEVTFVDHGAGVGTLRWQTEFGDVGEYHATFTLSDYQYHVDIDVTISISDVNRRPVWDVYPNPISAEESDLIQFTIEASDPDDDPLTIVLDRFGLPDEAQFIDNEDGTGRFSWQTDYTNAGEYVVTFIVSDGDIEVPLYIDIAITGINQRPEWTDIPDAVHADEPGDLIEFDAIGFDPDGDNLTITWVIPQGADFDETGNGRGSFSWQTTEDDEGAYYASFTLSDWEFDVTEQVIITVGNVNRPPEWVDTPGNMIVDEGDFIFFTVIGSDPDDDPLRIRDDGLPDEAQFTDNRDGSGDFEWQTGPYDSGEYTLTFTLRDGNYNVPAVVRIRVNDTNQPPEWTSVPGDTVGNEGETVNFWLRGFDNDGDDVTITFDDQGWPDEVTFNDLGDGRAVFAWDPGFDDAGEYIARFTLSDGVFYVDATVNITIVDVNCEPFWTIVPEPISVLEGEFINFIISGDDLDGDELTIVFDRAGWSDAARFTYLGSGSGIFAWQTNYTDAGDYTAHFTLSDGEFDVETDVEISVTDVNREPIWVYMPARITGYENSEVEIAVFAVDPDDDELTLTCTSDDLPGGWEFTGEGEGIGFFNWTPGYDDSGQYTATFTVSDGENASSGDVLITINNVNRPPQFTDIPVYVEEYELETVEFTISGSDPDGENVTLDMIVDDLPDEMQFSDNGDGSGSFYWETTYEDQGEYLVTFVISDGNLDTEGDVLVRIINVNREPVWVYVPDEITRDEGESFDFGLVARDPDDDQLTITIGYNDLPEEAVLIDEGDGRARFTWDTGLEDAGTYNPIFYLSDGVAVVETTITLIVNNVNQAPYWVQLPDTVSADEGTMFSLTVVGIDPDGDDLTTSHFSGDIPENARFTDHGDGTGTLEWEITYADAGVYTSLFTVNDGVLESTAPVTIIVNNVNNPPFWVDMPDLIRTDEGGVVVFYVEGVDSEGDALEIRYSSNDIPESADFTDFADGTGVFTWQTNFEDMGRYRALFTLSDGTHDVPATVIIIVGDVNMPPEWEYVPDTVAVTEGDWLEFYVRGSDPDGRDDLTIYFYSHYLPDDAEFADSGNGSGNFTWQTGYEDEGAYVGYLILSDGEYDVEAEVQIIVQSRNREPEWIELPDQEIEIDEGDLLQFNVTASDPDGDFIILSMTSPDLPEAAVLTDYADGTGVFTWQTGYLDGGFYELTLIVSDDEYPVEADLFISVGNQNRVPVWTEYPENLTVIGYVENDVSVELTAEDPDGDDLEFFWQWSGERPGDPQVNFEVIDDNRIRFTLNADRFEFGVYNVTFSVSDGMNEPQLDIAFNIGTDHFIYRETGSSHEIRIDRLVHFGDVLERDEPEIWDEIGVLTPDGVVSGSYRFTDQIDMPLSLLAYGDDPNTQLVEGFAPDEPFTFRYWDYDEGVEYGARAELIAGDRNWRHDGFSLIELFIGTGLTVEPGRLDFGQVHTYHSSSLNVTLRNTGTIPIESLTCLIDGQRFSVQDQSYDLDVDEEIEIEVTFSPQSHRAYNAVLHIRADFVDLATVELTGTGFETWYFHYTITGILHTIDVLQADIDGVPVGEDTEIGVMTPAGLCAGAVLVGGDAPYEIRVYGDDPETQEIDGFQVGEQFHFAFADTSGGDQIEVEATYFLGPDEWEEDGYSAVILSTGDAHFHPVINERAHHIVIDSVDYFGEALNYTDEIAAITPRGDVAGSMMVTIESFQFDAYGDNPDTRDVVEGFRTGEYIYFRLWDASSEIEVAVRAEWTEGPDRWADDGESHVVLTAVSDNNAPIFRPLDDITVTEDEEISILLNVIDGDDDPISLSLIGVNLPQGIAFTDLHNGRGLFSWTPTYNQAGQYIAIFRAFDGIDETTLEIPIRVINVNRPPVIAAVAPLWVTEGERLLLLLEADDPDGDPVSFSGLNLPVGASIYGSILRWTPRYDQAGEYDLTIRATDFGQPPLSDEELVHITVHETQRAPVWEQTVSVVRAHEGDIVELNVRAQDPDGDNLELTAFNLPDDAEFAVRRDDFNHLYGSFTWQTDYTCEGYYQPSFIASDGELADTMIVEIYILNVNRMPILEPIDNQTASVGSSVEFDVSASDIDDEDNGQLDISVRNAPPGLTLNDWDGSNGSYSWAPEEQGIFSDVRIRVSDSGGRGWDEQTIILTALPIDDVPPVITGLSPANEEILRINRPAIRANITDEGSGIDIVELTFDDQPCEDCTFNPRTGGLVWVTQESLSEGDHNYTVRAVDRAGNSASVNVVFVVNADPGVIEPDDESIYTLYDRIDLSGTTDPFVDVELWLDGDLASEAYADYRGRFTFEQVELNEKMNRFIMRGHDNLMAPVRVDVYLDIEPPDIDLTYPVGWISETMPRIRARIDDEGIGVDIAEGIYLAIDGVQFEGYSFLDGFLTYNIQNPLEEGEHVISIAAVDLLGNIPDDSLDAVIFIDSQAPFVDHPYFTEGMVLISNRSPELRIPITDPFPSSGLLGNDLVLSVDGEELDYEWFEIEQSVVFDFDGYDELEAGEHVIIVDVSDRARNNTRAAGMFFITDIQDNQAPVISNMFPPNGSTAGDGDGGFGIIPARFSADTVAFVISDNDVGVDWDTVWMRVIALNDPGDPSDDDTTEYLPGDMLRMPHGRVVAVMRNDGEGPQLSPNEMGGLQIGIIQVEAYGADEEGNRASQMWRFFFDPAAPEAPTLVEPDFYFTNDAVISINGFAGGDEPFYPDGYENLITIRIYRNDDIAAEIYANTFFDFTVPEILLVEGVNSITATMLDGGGNESEFSYPIELELDLTSPEITGFETPRGPHISDITPLFSAILRDQGTGILTADIVFSVDGIEYESVYNPNNGTLVASAMDDLEEGEHTARIDVSDRAGNTTSEEYSFEIHLPPVDPPEFELTPYTSTNRISLTGTSDSGNDIVIIVNDRETGIVETDDTDKFEFVYNAPELPEPTWVSLMAVSEEEVESEHTEPQMLRHDYTVPLFTGTQPENGTVVAVWELDSVSVHVSDADAGLDSEGFSISLMGEAVIFNSFESDSGYWLSADVADIEFVNNQTVEVIAGANDLAVPPNQGRLRWEFVTQVGASPILMLPDTSFNEDEQLALNLFAYADDPDHTWQDLNLTAELVEGDEHAQLALDEFGVLRVRAEENWFGRLSIAVLVVDPDDQSGADTMIVDVLPVNDAPVFDEIEDMVVDEGEIVQIWVTATDIDPDEQLTFSTTSNLFNLSPFGVAVFRALRAMRGVHEIELFVRDRAGATDRMTFELTINSVNRPVEAIGDIPDQEIIEDSESFTVASLDTIFFDADDDPLFYEVECRGGLIIEIDPESKQVTIEPERDFFGERRVTISADDRHGSTAYAEFWVTVSGINDPPERRGFLPFDISLNEDPGRYVIADLDSVFFDPDGDNIEFRTESGDSLGVMIDAYGILTLNPMPDWYGVQTFTLIADDNQEAEAGPVRNYGNPESVDFCSGEATLVAFRTGEATLVAFRRGDYCTMSNGTPSRDEYEPIDIMVEILPVNDPPRIIAPIEDQVFDEDSGPWWRFVNLFDVFVEVDGDDMEFFATAEQPLEVIWSNSNGRLQLSAPDNFHGLDLEVVVRAEDSFGLMSTDTFMVDILSINDPPQVMNHIPDQIYDEDSGHWTVANLDTIFFDPEGDPFYYDVRAEEPLVVEIGSDVHLLYVAVPEHFNGTDLEVTIIASDTPFFITTGAGFGSNAGRNPRAITRRDAGPVRQLRSSRSVWAEHLQPIQYRNRFDDSRPPLRDDWIEETFTVTITPVNDEPVWAEYPPNVQAAELDTIFFDVVAEDIDALYGEEQLTLRIVEENGVIERGALFTDNGDGTGSFYWQTDYDDAGDFYIVVEAKDIAGVAVYADISITVANLNRPLILAHELPDMEFAEDDSFRMDYNLNYHFNDADNDTLVFTIPEHHGIVYLLDEDNHLFLKPEPDWNGETDVVIAATDGYMQVTDTILVTVESINDLPTAFDLSQPADSVYRYSYPSVQFSWQESIDIVEDSTVTYNLVMNFNDTLHWYRDLPDTVLYVLREDFVVDPDEPTEVEWWVYAYDGIDSVRSDGTNMVIIAAITTFRPEDFIIPTELVLGNAYPNPFNDATRIPYDLPEPTDVVITIYDHTGRLVRTVENRYIHAGRHVAMWDGKDRYGIRSSAGLYFIKLKTGLGVKMSRVMLLR